MTARRLAGASRRRPREGHRRRERRRRDARAAAMGRAEDAVVVLCSTTRATREFPFRRRSRRHYSRNIRISAVNNEARARCSPATASFRASLRRARRVASFLERLPFAMSSPALPAGPEGVLSASFNQDFSCVAVATCRGFKIYSFDAGAWVYEDAVGAVRIVEMLHTSSLLAVVGAGDAPDLSPRRVKVLNTSTRACIADLAFTSTVLAVRLNRACLVVVEERRAVVHDLSTLAVQRVIDTPPNPRGVVALASDPDASALAVPSAADSGRRARPRLRQPPRRLRSPRARLAHRRARAHAERAHARDRVREGHRGSRPRAPRRSVVLHVSAWRRARERANPRVRTARGGRHGLRVPSVSLHGQGHRARVPRGGRAAAEGRARTRGGARRPRRGGWRRRRRGFFGGAVAAKVTDAMRSKRDAATVRLPPATVRLAADVAARGGVGVGGVCALRDATSADARGSRRRRRAPARDANRRGR